jgi:hypothetical protein
MLSVIDVGVWQVAAFLLRVDVDEAARSVGRNGSVGRKRSAGRKKREPYKPSPTDLPLKYFF